MGHIVTQCPSLCEVGAIVAAQEKAWYSIAAIETSTETANVLQSKLI